MKLYTGLGITDSIMNFLYFLNYLYHCAYYVSASGICLSNDLNVGTVKKNHNNSLRFF